MTLTARLVLVLSIVALGTTGCTQQRSIQVLVWDERQPKQKQLYKDFLGNHIAEDLHRRAGLSVRSAGMDDPQQGLSDELLDNCDVLIWWGHRRQAEISIETAQRIVDRVKTGKLNLIILHSAHWCTPFMLAMHERARQDALATLPSALRDDAKVEWLGEFERKAPAPDAELTPS
ncbi:MAG: type 1 glutamine amidotransferase family protein, partial [Planctomycetota bacterium]